MNEKSMAPHISGLVTGAGMALASGSAGMGVVGYLGGQLVHRALDNAARPGKINRQENPELRNKTQFGKK